MATVVITFFLDAQFSVNKMDADFTSKRSARISTQRAKRWSMSSQRLEEILAELMRPIGDLRHSFDVNLSALLEEYLTEAGLHVMHSDDGISPVPNVVPNFAEVALLLQQYASIYARKVDFLYQMVLGVSESLHNNTIEIANTTNEEEPTTPSRSRRKRRTTELGDFDHIDLEPHRGSTRRHTADKPPPTLPRVYIEIEPRVLGPGEEPLRDYSEEPIGVLDEFHVSWRLQKGLLVNELEEWDDERRSLRPIPLMELRAAIEANRPPSPAPLLHEDSAFCEDSVLEESQTTEPLHCSTPLPQVAQTEEMPPPAVPKRERKRKTQEDLNGMSFKLLITEEMRCMLSAHCEFYVPQHWIKVWRARRARDRRDLSAAEEHSESGGFRGFEGSALDVSGGFVGWSSEESQEAEKLVERMRKPSHRLSDDTGFQSDFSCSPESSPMQSTMPTSKTPAELAEEAEWAAWQATVAARAAASEHQPPPDVTQLAAAVLERVPDAGNKPFERLLSETATKQTDVSRLFLATLFLANAGNVEVIQGPPLSLNSFSLKLLSRDECLYSAAAASDPFVAVNDPSHRPNGVVPPAEAHDGPPQAKKVKK